MGRPKKIPILDPSRAIAYLRVSTDEQTLGVEAQRGSIEAWAARNGVLVVGWHQDKGISGAATIEDRPALMAALQDLSRLGAGLLVVAKLDRVARDLVVNATIEQHTARLGGRIVSADGMGQGDTPEAGMFRGMAALFAQYERALIRARTKAALQALRAQGKRAGSIPFGFRLAPDKVSLEANEVEQEAMRLARYFRDVKGLSLLKVAEELTKLGYHPRGWKWHAQTIARITAPE